MAKVKFWDTATSAWVVTDANNSDKLGSYLPNAGAVVNTIAQRDASGDLTSRILKSTIATGTAPLNVLSTTTVANLAADLLDGYHANSGTTANTIPVRDASGKLPGDILGNASTATTLAGTNPTVIPIAGLVLETDTRKTVFTKNATTGRLDKIEDFDGATIIQTINYGYDANGKLTSVTVLAGGKTVTYTITLKGDGSMDYVTKAVS